MNHRFVRFILGRVLWIEAALLLLPLAVSALYGESVMPFVWAVLLAGAAGAVLGAWKQPGGAYFAREGFVSVALSWIVISLVGALPFVLSGAMPNYIDALFEIISGFTTCGASVAEDVESMGQGILFWRSFSHWIGGMGVLVFMLAVMPMSEERSMHLMRAEVPGPVKGKLVPRMRHTARILYLIYIALTAAETVFLLFGGMSLFDALVHAFGTAGTGGFGIHAASVGFYDSAYIDGVITAFMLLFGVNFNLFYLLLLGNGFKALKNEELWVYIGIVLFAGCTIAASIAPQYGGFVPALRYAFFQTASVISTTGYATADFVLWPSYAKAVLMLLLVTGACAGSTAGGMKLSRVMILFKHAATVVRRQLFPRRVQRVEVDGQRMDEATLRAVSGYLVLWCGTLAAGFLLLSLQGLDLETTLTSALTCLSNVGPGLGLVGPSGSFAVWNGAEKLVLCLLMLLGRLEFYPVLMLLVPDVWRRRRGEGA